MFLEKVLKISNWQTKFNHNRFLFLKEYVRASLINLPFQNLFFTRFPVNERPNVELNLEIINEANVQGHGGNCSYINYYANTILSKMGFKTEIISGTFVRTGIQGSHMLTVVTIPEQFSKNKKTERYLVDLGSVTLLSEPINLDELPYKGKGGGMEFHYDWVNGSKTHLRLINISGDFLLGKKPVGYNSPQDCDIFLEKKDFSDFIKVNRELVEATHLPLHHAPILFRYLSFDDSSSDFKAVAVRGKEIVLGTKETREVKSFEEYDEMKPAIFHYFPMIPKEYVESSIENFKLSEKKMKK